MSGRRATAAVAAPASMTAAKIGSPPVASKRAVAAGGYHAITADGNDRSTAGGPPTRIARPRAPTAMTRIVTSNVADAISCRVVERGCPRVDRLGSVISSSRAAS